LKGVMETSLSSDHPDIRTPAHGSWFHKSGAAETKPD
jgi:hypothetical protein